MQVLLDKGIATRRGIMCAHREPAYQKESWRSAGPLTESEHAQDQCVLLPIFHQLAREDQQRIASELAAAVAIGVTA